MWLLASIHGRDEEEMKNHTCKNDRADHSIRRHARSCRSLFLIIIAAMAIYYRTSQLSNMRRRQSVLGWGKKWGALAPRRPGVAFEQASCRAPRRTVNTSSFGVAACW